MSEEDNQMTRNDARVVVLSTALALLGAGWSMAGCASRPVAEMPNAPRLVGGGMIITWTAPEPGTVFLIETRSGKIVETRSLKEGDIYSFAATSVVQADEFEQMLGIPFAKARFQLFFEPTGTEGSTGESAEGSEFVRTWSRT
jgi:hypothetical protein